MRESTATYLIIFGFLTITLYMLVDFVTKPPELEFKGYPSKQDQSLPVMSLLQLYKYNGVLHNWTFVAVKNVVFNVTQSNLYVRDKLYAGYAGKDISGMLLAAQRGQNVSRFANIYNTPKFKQQFNHTEIDKLYRIYKHGFLKKYQKVARIWFYHFSDKIPIRYEDIANKTNSSEQQLNTDL